MTLTDSPRPCPRKPELLLRLSYHVSWVSIASSCFQRSFPACFPIYLQPLPARKSADAGMPNHQKTMDFSWQPHFSCDSQTRSYIHCQSILVAMAMMILPSQFLVVTKALTSSSPWLSGVFSAALPASILHLPLYRRIPR